MSQSRAWSWRHAIIKSDLPPTTRHVLLTISCYMNEMGDGCYPKQSDLVKASGLSERAIRDHLEIAEQRGWIKRQEHGFRGQKWRNHEYFAAWPETPDVEKGAAPDAGPFQDATAPPSETCGTSFQKVRHDVPTTSPNTSPSTSPPVAKATEGEEGFSILWSSWPEIQRPDSRNAAWKLFSKLSDLEQAKAISGAEPYRKAMVSRGKPPRMVVYLRDRLFLEFHDNPETDADGNFVLRPRTPEWGAWLRSIRREYGEPGVERAARHQFMKRKTRWPDDLSLADSVTKMAPSVAETATTSAARG